MSEKTPSVRTYIIVFVALLLLAAFTTGIAYVNLGKFNTIAALAIAVIKMCLVGLFFMHLWYSPGLTRIVVLAGFFWLALMVSFILTDVFTRSWIKPPGPFR
jgi:cytochrome c oxidase subunit 4